MFQKSKLLGSPTKVTSNMQELINLASSLQISQSLVMGKMILTTVGMWTLERLIKFRYRRVNSVEGVKNSAMTPRDENQKKLEEKIEP